MYSKKSKSLFQEYLEAFIIAICIAVFVRLFIAQAYRIPSGSMLETLQIGDYLFVNKLAYNVTLPFTDKTLFETGDPQFQDVLVFKYPDDPSKDFIKRVIGLPGDVLEMREKKLYRNGELLVEPYVKYEDPNTIIPIRDNFGPFTVPENSYFMLGDNRDSSQDSRFWGFVKRSALVGKAWRIYFSIVQKPTDFSGNEVVDTEYEQKEPYGTIRWSRIGKKIE
ncbi:MAG: signal peptidase I [Desulfovibrionaceae bacterium]